MTLTVGAQLLNTFKEPLLKITKDFKDEFLFLFNNGLSEYIDNFYDKYSKTKTFIYRDEKVNFYDIYFPVTLKSNTESISAITDLKVLFSNRKFITIIGSAGCGKSMFMKHIFLSAVNQTYRIPLVIELRNLNDYQGNITEYINKIITRNKIANSEKFIERVLEEGNFLFLLYGYDEIYSYSKDKITTELEEFVDTYSKNTFVITSRPGSNAESLQRFDNFYVQPLNKKQINEFVNLQFKNHESKESVGKIISVIEKPDNRDYKDYLSNPLLLSMFIFAFNNYPELPKIKNKFYWNVFDTLCTKHDSFTKKGFWLHERKSKLLNDDFENILKWFSYITIFKGKYNFDLEFLKSNLLDIKSKLKIDSNVDDIIYDLTVSISILIQDGTDLTFPHKSLQEYFTAILIKGLNEEQKKKIYEEKFNNLKKYTTGGNLNLFKLCYEIDKSYFSKYFLIPNTENFIKSLDNTSEDNLTKSFVEAFDLNIFFSKNEDGTFQIGGCSYNNLPSDSFLSFFNLGSLLPFSRFKESETSTKHIKNLLETKLKLPTKKENFERKTLNIVDDWSDETSLFISESGINENFKKLYRNIVKSLEILKKEIDTENVNTKELLDI